MSKRDELMKMVRECEGYATSMNNSIMAALDPSNPMYLLTFHSFFPPQVMFYSYGANFTIKVSFNNGASTPYRLTPNGYKTLAIPVGTTKLDVETSDITIVNPSFAGIVTTF
jgi:hypothetical protein